MARIAYLILVHKNFPQVVRLVNQLVEDSLIYIHVDKKSGKGAANYLKQSLANKENVHILQTHRVYWGDFSQIVATISILQRLVASKDSFDYVKFLSGQDYPVVSSDHIVKFINNCSSISYIQNFRLPSPIWEDEKGGLERINYYHFRVIGSDFYTFPPQSSSLLNKLLQKMFIRRFPDGLIPFGGSAYWLLTHESVDYILRFITEHPRFVRFFRHVVNGDEIFFQTILLNSPLKDQIVNDDLTFAKWVEGSSGPEILKIDDSEEIFSSGSLFARKFDMYQDEAILDLIDKRKSRILNLSLNG